MTGNKSSFPIDYDIKRSPRRRTISITVDAGKVMVRVPKRMTERQIRAFVQSKSQWIRRKQAETVRMEAERPGHRYAESEIFPFQGSEFTLTILNTGGRNSISIKDQKLILRLRRDFPPGDIPNLMRKWYIERARAAFRERMSFFSEELGVAPAGLSVRDQKSRWGSCSSRGKISLNWKLVTAPPDILDYVVAHELCHLKHRNHKSEFWRDLAVVIPDFQERRKWLRENGHRLGL